MPSLLLVLTFAYFPAVSAVHRSFFIWNGDNRGRVVALQNFRHAFGDATLWGSFGTVGVLVVANIVKLIPSVGMAVLVHRHKSARSQYLQSG